MIDWLNTNAGAVSTLASVVSAIAAVILMGTTIVYAVYTSKLADENRLLRKAGTDPQVIAYATTNPRVFSAIDFVIRNVGKGAARNVSYKVISSGGDLAGRNVRLLPEGVAFSFLPQEEQLSSSMGMGWDLLKAPIIQPFDVEVSYEDMVGNRHRATFRIDIGQFKGLGRLGRPADERIADSLEKIEKVVGHQVNSRLSN